MSTLDEKAFAKDKAVQYGLDSSQVLMFYYQQFGFTDVCEDIRIACRMKSPPILQNALPISDSLLYRINSMENKTDSIDRNLLRLRTDLRIPFSDIENEFIYFHENESDSLFTLKLNEGSYEFLQTETAEIFKVFDKESGVFYVEVHKCP